MEEKNVKTENFIEEIRRDYGIEIDKDDPVLIFIKKIYDLEKKIDALEAENQIEQIHNLIKEKLNFKLNIKEGNIPQIAQEVFEEIKKEIMKESQKEIENSEKEINRIKREMIEDINAHTQKNNNIMIILLLSIFFINAIILAVLLIR